MRSRSTAPPSARRAMSGVCCVVAVVALAGAVLEKMSYSARERCSSPVRSACRRSTSGRWTWMSRGVGEEEERAGRTGSAVVVAERACWVRARAGRMAPAMEWERARARHLGGGLVLEWKGGEEERTYLRAVKYCLVASRREERSWSLATPGSSATASRLCRVPS